MNLLDLDRFDHSIPKFVADCTEILYSLLSLLFCCVSPLIIVNKYASMVHSYMCHLHRLFFKACGFGEDMLESTTMMYARSSSSYLEEDQQMVGAGRKMLVVPPQREFKKL